ncbi:MAG: hypothetical protein D6785_04565, partial [Planctomycetota bacterium]
AKTREELEKLQEMVLRIESRLRRLQQSKKISEKVNFASYIQGLTPQEIQEVSQIRQEVSQIPEELLNSSLYRDLANFYALSGSHGEAEKLFQRALEKAKKSRQEREEALVYYNLFLSHLAKTPPDLSQALEWYQKSLSFSPEVIREMELFDSAHYKPLSILGMGGFGIDFLCEDQYLGGKVVVKAIQEELTNSEEALKEARMLHKLHSPYMVPLKGCNFVLPHQKKKAYLVMEYFPGEDLEKWVKAHGAFPAERALEIGRDISRGILEAHRAKILHRDLKPSNILYRETEKGFELKIIDFGLALKDDKYFQEGNLYVVSQRTGILGSSFAGTLDFGAPEQLGKPGFTQFQVGPWSDVYSFGRLMFYLLFQTPFPNPEELFDYPHKDLVRFLSRCIYDHPGKRLQNFEEVLKELEGLLGG